MSEGAHVPKGCANDIDRSFKTGVNMPDNGNIIIKGAKVNNLKNVNIDIPKNKLVIMTGNGKISDVLKERGITMEYSKMIKPIDFQELKAVFDE